MTVDRNTLLSMLQREPPTDDVRTAMALLDDRATRVDDKTSCVSADELLRVWRVRLWNLERKGITAYGLKSLIASLEKLGEDEEVLGFAYGGPVGTGLFFVRKQDLSFVGFVVIT